MQVRLETATSSSTVLLIKPRPGCPDACPCSGKCRAEKGLSNASWQLHQTQSFLLLADQAHRLAQGTVRIQGTRLSGKEEENTSGTEPVETRGRFFLLHFRCQRQNYLSAHRNKALARKKGRTGNPGWKQIHMTRRREKVWVAWTGSQGGGFPGVWDTKVIVRKRKNSRLVSE